LLAQPLLADRTDGIGQPKARFPQAAFQRADFDMDGDGNLPLLVFSDNDTLKGKSKMSP
jgi:hypothetical protein